METPDACESVQHDENNFAWGHVNPIMATQGPSITSSLQDTFHRIETLGNPGGNSYRFPPPPSSRITDSVIGTTHDFHAIRAPIPTILEEGGPVAMGGGAAAVAANSANKSKKKYIIGIVIVSILLIGIAFAIFFLKRRNNKRIKDEQEAEQKAEEQFKEDMIRKMHEEAQKAAAVASVPSVVSVPPVQSVHPAVSVPSVPSMPAPVPLAAPVRPTPPLDHDKEMEAAVAETFEKRKRQEQLEAAEKRRLQEELDAAERRKKQLLEAAEKEKQTKLEELARQEAHKKQEERKRQEQLETLRNKFSSGINNVVGSISDHVSRTIASQRAFSAHSSDQEFDEKVLLDTGKPSISTAPADDSHLPSIGLLNVELDAHPDPAVIPVDVE